ncbi:hypothetical protein FACS1894189_2050 [Planctomycetales bacterium]|nr:hypothetical protein FACS1894189_2050 [Planctomycetales bacterium]
MIHSEKGLMKTQELVTELERSLVELRHRIQPVNEPKYRLMAEGYISQLRQLREEIDEYIGISVFDDTPQERELLPV